MLKVKYLAELRSFARCSKLKILPLLLISLISTPSITSAETAQEMLIEYGLYYDWLLKPGYEQAKYGMELQRRLAANTPFYWTSVLGTHNSYNSTAYGIPMDSLGQTGQQKISVRDQIDLGAEWIELDYYNHNGTLKFCHGVFNCLFGEWVMLADVFNELGDWVFTQLPLGHPYTGTERVVMIHIQNLNGDKGEDATLLAKNLSRLHGDFSVYTPLDYEEDFPNGRNYAGRSEGKDVIVNFPSKEISKQVIRNKGKRFVIFMSGGDTPGEGNELWDSVFWHRGGLQTQKSNDNKDAMDDWLGGKQVVEYCGYPGPNSTDGKFRNNDALWSWSSHEPNSNGNQNCAALKENGRWYDLSCSRDYVYACRRNLYGQDNYLYPDDHTQEGYQDMWALSSTAGDSGANDLGENACKELGQGWYHAVPHNAIESEVVRQLLADDPTHDHAWVAYTDEEDEGNFVEHVSEAATEPYFGAGENGVFIGVDVHSPKMEAYVVGKYPVGSCTDTLADDSHTQAGQTNLLIDVGSSCLENIGFDGWVWDLVVVNDDKPSSTNVEQYTLVAFNGGSVHVSGSSGVGAYNGETATFNDGHVEFKLVSAPWDGPDANNYGIGFIVKSP